MQSIDYPIFFLNTCLQRWSLSISKHQRQLHKKTYDTQSQHSPESHFGCILDQFALYKQVKEALNTLFCFDKWHSKWFLQLILWIETRGSISPLLFVNSRGLPFWFYDACMSNDMLSISHLLFADDTYMCKIHIIFVTWDVYSYVSKSFQDLCG